MAPILPPLTTIPTPVVTPDLTGPITAAAITPSGPALIVQPTPPPQPPKTATPIVTKPQVSPPKPPAPASPVAPKKHPNISSVDLTKIINSNQVTGQLLTLPPSVLNHLDLKQPLALRVDDKMLMIPPNCFISSGSSIKVFLPPGTLPKNLFQEPSQPVNFNFQSKQNQQVLNFSIGSPAKKKRSNITDETENSEEAERAARLSKKQLKMLTPEKCHFQKLHTGYDCMIKIFKYLKISDLLR